MKISTLELDFYKKLYENDIEGLDMEQYKRFLPFDSTKLNLFNTNYPVKKRASYSDLKKAKDKVVASICGEIKLT